MDYSLKGVKKMLKKLYRRLLVGGALFLVALLLLFAFFYPILNLYRTKKYSLEIYASQGELLYIFPLDDKEGLRREKVDLEKLPSEIVDLFIQSEDSRFYLHWGVDLIGVGRAVQQNREAGEIVSGASTISMQLARLLREESHKNPWLQKGREAIDSFGLELFLTKKQILSAWISLLPFGFNVEGIESASRLFFNKSANLLTIEEGALLAILPRSPSHYHPIRYGERLFERAHFLLVQNEFDFSKTKLEEALEEMQSSLEARHLPIVAPHFCQYLKQNHTGKNSVVKTSLNLNMQLFLEAKLGEAVVRGYQNRLENGAILVLDNKTGEIISYIGSVDFYDIDIKGQNDGVHALNEPGSTLKPFIYQLGLERGWNAAKSFADLPMEINEGNGVYRPMNFNNRFNGPVLLREALASSLNIPAILATQELGLELLANRLKDLGFHSIVRQKEGLGVAISLGAVSFSLFELTTAYAVLARGGINFDGKRILQKDESYLVIDILSDYSARVRGFGAINPFDSNYDFFIKTGTSNQFHDIWAFVGTPDLTIGIWMGNFDGSTIVGYTGSSLPAQIAYDFLENFAIRGSQFPKTTEFRENSICPLSGGKATSYCPIKTIEKFIGDSENPPCSFHSEEGLSLPPIYERWAKEVGLEFNVEAGGRPSLIRPAQGVVFYIDPTKSLGKQAPEFEVVAGQEEQYWLYLNEKEYYRGQGSLVGKLPTDAGKYELRLVEQDKSATTISYEVR